MNRDTIVALALLVICGVFFQATFDIRDMGYETIGSEVWPRLILTVLTVLSAIYLVQSLARGKAATASGGDAEPGGFVSRYRNAIWCYALFLAFLLTLPWLGMLIGGVLFVFAVLTAIGNRTPRDHLVHAAIAIGTIGAMWAVFTFVLRVILPEGEILRIW